MEQHIHKAANLLNTQREFFYSGATRPRSFRRNALRRLAAVVRESEQEILDAAAADLGKSEFEAYTSEVFPVISEIRYAVSHLRTWTKRHRVPTPLALFPARSSVERVPYGVTLVISPWNYPFQLALSPLVGAVAGGNCCVVKPSEHAVHTSKLISRLISRTFDPGHVAVAEGDAETSRALVQARPDYIFYTGGKGVARSIMATAAKDLVPVTLELGGKSPAIVDRTAHLETTARRLVWGKFFNAGQTCVAPDFAYVHEGVKEELASRIREELHKFYGANAAESSDYGRIINDAHFRRLQGLMTDSETSPGSRLVSGGTVEAETRYIEPAIYHVDGWDEPLMQDEIFGPLFPFLSFSDVDELIADAHRRPRPLAAYLFSTDRALAKKFAAQYPSGGGCINDTLIHFTSPHIPFGGIGSSGMGVYHGRASFETFTHPKGMMTQFPRLDLPLKYPPAKGKLHLLKPFLK